MSLGICTRCKKEQAIAIRGKEAICHKCAEAEMKRIAQAVKGGVMIDPAPGTVEEAEQIVSKARQVGKIIGCEVLFLDEKNNRKMVHITEKEQLAIVRKILDNRRAGKKVYEYMNVALFDMPIVQKMERLIDGMAKIKLGFMAPAEFLGLQQLAQEIIKQLQQK
jgi:translation initiation factor IF-2